MGKILGVIPARYSSKRFPGKLLEEVLGKPIIQRVIENAQKYNFIDDLVVAVEENEREIYEFVLNNFSTVKVVKTKGARSGTERAFMAYKKINGTYDACISIPADEPFLLPENMNIINKEVRKNTVNNIYTLYTNFYCWEDLEDSSSCKIVSDRHDNALYFSRSIIPASKSDYRENKLNLYKKHIGIFIFLSKYFDFVGEELWSLNVSGIEKSESLEQIRFIHYGSNIKLLKVSHNYFGIDNPQQIPFIEKRYLKLRK